MADQPVNFLQALGVLPEPATSFLTGVQHAEDRQYLNSMRQAQIAEIKDKVEAARAAREEAAAFQAAIASIDPSNPQEVARVMMRFPKQAEGIKGAYTVSDEGARKADQMYLGKLYGLMRGGNYEGAFALARDRYDAEVKAGKADEGDTAFIQSMEQAVTTRDPAALRAVQTQVAAFLAAQDPVKFAEAFGGIQDDEREADLHPLVVKKAEADATKAGVDARYAEPMAQLEMADTRSQMSTRELQAQIAAGNLDVARQRLALDREKAAAEGAKGKAPTESQIKDAFNAKRMARATGIIAGIEPSTYGERVKLAATPFSAQRKKYDAAKMEWADAMLRLTSGAEAPEPEVRRTAETYFPTGVDGEDVIRQKAEMRRQIMRDAIMRAGDAAAGLVLDGYRFKGGDPAQKSSWEKVG